MSTLALTGDRGRMGTPLLLGIDIGSSRIKALLLTAGGDEIAVTGGPGPFADTPEGTEATVERVRRALEDILARCGSPLEDVIGIGVTGVAESGVPLDGDGRSLGPIIAWHDRRGEEVAARLAGRFGDDLAVRIGQRLRHVSSVAKLGWLREQGLPAPRAWLGVPELALHLLTGERATELSLAARTGCWDIRDRRWLSEVTQSAGFAVDVFPPVLAAGEVMGRISPAASGWSGLPPGIPITVAGHDHLAGITGSGAGEADLVNSVGTAETVVGRRRDPPDPRACLNRGVAVTLMPGGRAIALLSSAARAGIAVETAAAALGRSPAELDALAVGVEPLEAPELLRSLRGREPPVLPEAPPPAVWSTLLDCLSRCTAEAVDRLTPLIPPSPRLVIFGGGSGSGPWCTARARHLELPLWRSIAAEAAARGAALHAGVAAGLWETVEEGPRATVVPIVRGAPSP